jgi:hypothetical protein
MDEERQEIREIQEAFDVRNEDNWKLKSKNITPPHVNAKTS